MSTMPTVLTTVERTRNWVSATRRPPSLDRTLSCSGNVPDVRDSTANRTVVLLGLSVTSRLEPCGKTSFGLASSITTSTRCPVSFRKVRGISPERDVSVIVLRRGTWIWDRNWSIDRSMLWSVACARACPAGPAKVADTDRSSERLPATAIGSLAPASDRNAASRSCAAR